MIYWKFSDGKPNISRCIFFYIKFLVLLYTKVHFKEAADQISMYSWQLKFGASHAFVKSRSIQHVKTLQKSIEDKNLADLVLFGVCFHNASWPCRIVKNIEAAFAFSYLMVICSTCTLAVGVNFSSSRRVKGTTTFHPKRNWIFRSQYYANDWGRAGRPQFDDSAYSCYNDFDWLETEIRKSYKLVLKLQILHHQSYWASKRWNRSRVFTYYKDRYWMAQVCFSL
jgi:replicative superfamily II helicase